MKNTKKKLNKQSKIVKVSFTGSNITRYAGLNTIAKYMNRQNIVQAISSSFPTIWYNATRFGINQILMAITLSSISGISRNGSGQAHRSGIKKKNGGKYVNQHKSVWAKHVPFTQKSC